MDDMLKRNEQITNATLNRLRAAVLGANDGIVSVSSVVMGVAGATSNAKTIFTAG
jgi:VIT1/CCC1 family predicted Fe2+/Mn2+ transporter